MLGNKKECRLLFGCEDNTYNEKQIGNIVLNSTFNKIGESSYFKILIKHYKEENNIDMIRFLRVVSYQKHENYQNPEKRKIRILVGDITFRNQNQI